jgi:hypothetical protein
LLPSLSSSPSTMTASPQPEPYSVVKASYYTVRSTFAQLFPFSAVGLVDPCTKKLDLRR